MIDIDQLAKRFENISNEIGEATLVAVTKYSDVREINVAYDIGHRDFGENRVSDLETKAKAFRQENRDGVRWHFIGHLQTNKVSKLIKIHGLYAIHSVDSEKLLREILKYKEDILSPISLFFQVNTSGEKEKGGFEDYESLKKAVANLLKLSSTSFLFEGLMTMGTYRTEHKDEEAKRCFKLLKSYGDKLKEDFKLDEVKLSMGMSDDYKIALKEGSDLVRVGSLLFK